MHILHSKHQKLILQCYPPGKAVDKKPNSSELQYLLYYASTRSVKLEKVFHFIHRKTESDVSSARSGNLQVTLAIISALIEKCSDNLNVFADESCQIIQLVLKVKDIALGKSAVATFGVLCKYLDGGLFSGDKKFVKSFVTLSENLIEFSRLKSNNAGPDALDWKVISIKACNYITACHDYTVCGKHFTFKCIPLLVDTIWQHNKDEVKLKSNLLKYFDLNSNTKDRRISTVSAPPQTQETNDNINEDDIDRLSALALKSYFNTTSAEQISDSTSSLVSSCIDHKDPSWGSTLLEVCTLLTPVQLRFYTLASLVNTLSKYIENGSSNEAFDYQRLLHYAQVILGLVSSDVSMIGLSVTDINQQLLSLQTFIILEKTKLSADQVNTLLGIFSKIICNLSSHIYYSDQIQDTVRGILMKVHLQVWNHLKNPIPPTKLVKITKTLLDNIPLIFDQIKNKSSSITRNHVQMEIWESTLPLLCPEIEFADYSKDILSYETINEISYQYLKTFRLFLDNEFVVDSKENDDGSGSETFAFNKSRRNYLQADVNKYISNPENFIKHFLLTVDKILQQNVSNRSTDVILLLFLSLKDLATIMGINFLYNFIPFFYHWVATNNNELSLKPKEFESLKLKETIAYSILNHVLEIINNNNNNSGMGEMKKNYISNSEFLKFVKSDIEYRKNHGLWDTRLDSNDITLKNKSNSVNNVNSVPITSDDLNANNASNHYKASKKALQDFIDEEEYLITWINPIPSLIIEGNQINSAIEPSSAIAPHVNDYTLSLDDESMNSDINNASYSHPNGVGLGLGTTGDIISIHSEIVNHNNHNNYYQTIPLPKNGFIINNNNNNNNNSINYNLNNSSNHELNSIGGRSFVPTVSDLKSTRVRKNSVSSEDKQKNSVLSRQIKKNVDSILLELDDDLDKLVV